MKRNSLAADDCLAAAPGFTSLSDEELTRIAGGGIWNAVGEALAWFAEQVAVQTAATAAAYAIVR
jgi:hypothetical protein